MEGTLKRVVASALIPDAIVPTSNNINKQALLTLFSGRTSRSGDFGRERREFAGRRRPDFFDYLVDYEVEGRTDARLRVIFDNRHCTSMQSIIG
jgi:hypothetical protein